MRAFSKKEHLSLLCLISFSKGAGGWSRLGINYGIEQGSWNMADGAVRLLDVRTRKISKHDRMYRKTLHRKHTICFVLRLAVRNYVPTENFKHLRITGRGRWKLCFKPFESRAQARDTSEKQKNGVRIFGTVGCQSCPCDSLAGNVFVT